MTSRLPSSEREPQRRLVLHAVHRVAGLAKQVEHTSLTRQVGSADGKEGGVMLHDFRRLMSDNDKILIVEGARQIRKVTKNKGVFPSDTASEKLVYLAVISERN